MKLHKSFILLFLPLLLSCNRNPVYTVSISPSILSMTIGDVQTLDVNTNASDVEWSSENDSVATVFYGVVTAKGIGHTNIIAKVDGATAVCVVTVSGRDGATLSLSPAYVEVEKGSSYQYSYTSSYDVPLTWTSSNEEVATVDPTGHVTPLKSGHTTITLSNGVEECSSVFAVKHVWGEYRMVWSDEFDGNALDLDTWTIEINGSGGGNQERQYYTDRPENLRVEDGNLVIELRKEDYEKRSYTSGRINSREKKFFKYGKFEARISLPSGGGTWPAFWMMGNDYKKVGWPKCGEIDIIEHVGNQPTMCSFALHTPEKNGTRGNNWSSRSYFQGVEGNYHTYGIEWMEEENNGCDVICFTYDGQVCTKVQENIDHLDDNYYWPFNKDFFIIFNLAIGGTMGGNIDDSIFESGEPVLMKVDWVRVYQRDEL